MKLHAVFAAVLVATLAAPPARAADAGNAHVYLQRTSDGRVILTDRPLDGARTERTWQLQREDPSAARARAESVHRDAEAVAERIARRIALDEQHLMRDSDRRNVVSAEDALNEGPAYGGSTLVYPGSYGYGPLGGRQDGRFARQDGRFVHHGEHFGKHRRGPLLNTGAPRMAPRPVLTAPF